MPTIIDALIVTLGLDAKEFKKGQDETTKALDETKRHADTSARGIADSQSKTQDAFRNTGSNATSAASAIEKGAARSHTAVRQLDTGITAASKSIGEAGKTMLEPFAALAVGLGTAALSIGTIKRAIDQAATDSATGKAAQMSGIPVGDYSTYGKASQLLGGDSNAAMQTMSNLAMMQQAASVGNITAQAQLFERLGIHPNQPIPEINKQLNRLLQGMPQARQSYILSQLGYDSGSAYLEEQTPSTYDATLAQAAKDRITAPQLTAELAITKAYNGLLESVESLTRSLTVDAAPSMISFAHTMTDFVQGFQQSALYKLIATGGGAATALNTANTDAQKAGATVHKWITDFLGLPSSNINPFPGSGPRGLRNNNPLNLKYAGQPGAHDDGTDAHFAVFDTMDNGVNADYNQMLLDYGRGANTINKLVPKWTTTDRAAYAATVLSKMRGYGYNITGDSQIDLTNPAVAQAMISSMSVAEGDGPFWMPSKANMTTGLSKNTVSVLANLRSMSTIRAHGSGGGGAVHHHGGTEIHVSVTVPSGDPHAIAHVVKRELRKATTQQTNSMGGSML